MKKVILSLVTLLAATTLATAQMRPSIKVEAGANFANQTTKVENNSTDGKMMIGYRAGVGVEFGFAEGFYVNPGVYFLSRGAKSEAIEMLLSLIHIYSAANMKEPFIMQTKSGSRPSVSWRICSASRREAARSSSPLMYGTKVLSCTIIS